MVNQFVLLAAPNTLTGNIYRLDNLSIHAAGVAAATSLRVASVTTGTAAAGGGKKFAPATVVGDFSGTLTQTNVSALTDATGKATLKTTAGARGTLTVNFCVRSVSAGSLAFDKAGSTGVCP